MFSIGEKVVYKTNAVCCVEALETPSFVSDRQKKYYKLRVLYSVGNEVIYVPVENESAIRKVVTKDKAEKCFDYLKNAQISEEESKQPAVIAEHFQRLLSNYDIESSLLVLKEILLRKEKFEKEGRNLRQAENQYLAVAKKAATCELACVLDVPLEEIEQRIMKVLALD